MKQFLVLFAALYALSACQRTVIIELPPHEPKLVLHALWSQGQNQEIWAWVGNNISIMDNTQLDSFYYSPMDRAIPYEGTVWVHNATVELYQNGVLFQTLHTEEGARVYTAPFLVDNLNPNANYELRVSAPNYPSISAQVKIVPAPSVSNPTLTPDGVNTNGVVYDLIQVDINDPVDTENYYYFALKYTPKDSTWGGDSYYQWLETSDPNAESNNTGVIVTDKTFNGQNRRVDFWAYGADTANHWISLEVYNLGKDVYLFNRSLQLHYENQNNPFAEPVVIYSNVTNGRGIASGSSRQIFDLN